MITEIKATNVRGAILDLLLDDVSNGVVVEEVEGLDPVDATIVSSGFAQIDGTVFQSVRRDERQIKLKIGLEPDYATDTVAKIRKRLYAWFMPKSALSLVLIDDEGLEVAINGMVESAPAPLFTEDPQMDVVIRCFNPDFAETVEDTFSGNTVSANVDTTLTYDGTVETGFVFTMVANRTISSFTIYQTASDGSQRTFDFSAPMVSGDTLKISTVPGNKYATLTHLGVDASVLYGISPQSPWLDLLPGANLIRVYTTGAAIPFTIKYTNKYGGL